MILLLIFLSNNNAFNFSIDATFGIDGLVTDHIRLVSINIVLFHKVSNHFGMGLSTVAFFLGRMWTNSEVTKGGKLHFSKIILQLLVNQMNIFKRKVSTANT